MPFLVVPMLFWVVPYLLAVRVRDEGETKPERRTTIGPARPLSAHPRSGGNQRQDVSDRK
jgi:hypothetical protein